MIDAKLWLANSNPPHLCRREFYAVKDRILRRFGERDATPHDWQHIVRECFACQVTAVTDGGRILWVLVSCDERGKPKPFTVELSDVTEGEEDR